MITYECERCHREQSGGKHCIDCGGRMVQKVTLGVKFNPVTTSKAPDAIKKDIRKWLTRIGVQNQDIQISPTDETGAQVDYVLVGRKYSFKSIHQRRYSDNLAAVEIFLHNRVIGIERRIETIDKAFSGYAALPGPQNYETMSESQLRELLKQFHPDSAPDRIGNFDEFTKVKAEIDRRNA